MIRHTAGFAPVSDNEPVKPVNPTLPSIEAAKAAALARETEVLEYSRKKAAQEPLKQNLRTDGPKFEVWVASGYLPEKYPPAGYAEIPSPALEAYKATQSGQTPAPHSVNDKPEVTP